MALLEKNIKKLYWINAFNGMGFHLVVYTLFMLSKGFTMQQFFIIEAAYTLVNLLTEIPTGMFSDRVSRKKSLVIAAIPGIIWTPILILSDSFIVCLILMALGGLTTSFVSGTDTALMYDTLKLIKKEKDFKKIQGKMRWYGSWAGAFGGIVGGIIATFSLSYPWWAMYIVSFPILFVTLSLKEPPISRKSVLSESQQFHITESFKHSFGKVAGYFVFYAAIIWLFFSLSFWLWQPYLKLTALPITFFGIFYAVERLVSGYASKHAHNIEKKLGMAKSLLFIPLILVLALFLESKFVFILGFGFIFLQSIASGYFGPLLDDYINSRIPSSKRATVLSIKNMLNSLLFTVLSPLLGYAVDLYSLPIALMIMAVILLITSIIFYIIFNTINKTKSAPSHQTPARRKKRISFRKQIAKKLWSLY